MKLNQTAFVFLAALALAAFVAGCASNNDLLDRENAVVGAGFKVITPTKPDQAALLRKLPADRVTQITYDGKIYYVLPDLKNNQAYVGGPKQYKAYQQFRGDQKLNAESGVPSSSSSIKVVEVTEMNWGGWDGWGPMGEPGWY